MTQQTPNQADANEWSPCPTGAVSGMVSTLKSQRRGQKVVRTAAFLGVLLLIGGSLIAWGPRMMESHAGGISCSEVRQAAPAYMAGTLDVQMVEKIRQHLSECSHCRKKLEQADHHAMQDDGNNNDSFYRLAHSRQTQ